jgi:Fur family ferric uptake transcriptional regulator|tara:strand:+ start:91 stop:543 length:453 start_codon:yes stop_codon:yes gene_type:complete
MLMTEIQKKRYKLACQKIWNEVKFLKIGVRITLPRKIILEVIESSEDHPDVDEIYRRAVAKDKSISIATVYRTIKLFEEANIIEKLDIGDGRARYEEAGAHHEHLIDVDTGDIIEFQNEELEEMKRQVALKMGYELVDHKLELFGKKIIK